MPLPPGSRDLVRVVLGVLLIVLLIGGTLWILRPFLPAVIWATMIVVATGRCCCGCRPRWGAGAAWPRRR